ncbi:hypothetical protein EYB25_010033 [Talaromyces marneffei]|nr:hypothetical protein EYB25_010033 [Talaromyces marneffei]
MEADIFSINSTQYCESHTNDVSGIYDALAENAVGDLFDIESFDLSNIFDENSNILTPFNPIILDNALQSGESFTHTEFQTSLPLMSESVENLSSIESFNMSNLFDDNPNLLTPFLDNALQSGESSSHLDFQSSLPLLSESVEYRPL